MQVAARAADIAQQRLPDLVLVAEKLPERTRDGDAFFDGRQKFERQTRNAVQLAHNAFADDRHFRAHLFGVGVLQVEGGFDPLLFKPGRPTPQISPTATPAAFIEYFGEEGRLVLGIRTVRDDRADASLTRRLAISRRIVALIGHRRPRHYIGTSFEQRLEILAIAGLSAGEMETDGMTVLVCF